MVFASSAGGIRSIIDEFLSWVAASIFSSVCELSTPKLSISLPEAVSYDREKNPLGRDHTKLPGKMVAAP